MPHRVPGGNALCKFIGLGNLDKLEREARQRRELREDYDPTSYNGMNRLMVSPPLGAPGFFKPPRIPRGPIYMPDRKPLRREERELLEKAQEMGLKPHHAAQAAKYFGIPFESFLEKGVVIALSDNDKEKRSRGHRRETHSDVDDWSNQHIREYYDDHRRELMTFSRYLTTQDLRAFEPSTKDKKELIKLWRQTRDPHGMHVLQGHDRESRRGSHPPRARRGRMDRGDVFEPAHRGRPHRIHSHSPSLIFNDWIDEDDQSAYDSEDEYSHGDYGDSWGDRFFDGRRQWPMRRNPRIQEV